MDRHTGRALSGWDHIRQSIVDIFTTRIGTRIERRFYGSAGPDLVDEPSMSESVLDNFVAMAEALDQFEPRVELSSFEFIDTNESGDAQIMVNVIEVSTGNLKGVEVAA